MKIKSFSFIALRILLLALKSTAQPPPTVQCPTLLPDQHVSSVQCENQDGSVVEVNGPRTFNCKLSWVAIRARTNTHEQEEQPLNEEGGQCKVWVFQFSDNGLVQQSCCGEVGDGHVVRVSRAQQQQDQGWDPAQEWLEFHEELEEPVQHFQMDNGPLGEDEDEDEDYDDEIEEGQKEDKEEVHDDDDGEEDEYADEEEDVNEDGDGDIEFGAGSQHIFVAD